MREFWKQWEGQIVGGVFPLRRLLGGSGESAVFLTDYGGAEPQKAAIKLIPAHATSPELQLSRWRRAAKLPHPHLIQLFQMGRFELDDTELVYVVMEWAEEDLSQVLPERPLTPEEAHTMLKSTLDALAYLHEKGFAHGRLKPANILAIGDQIKLSSDGISRIGGSGVGLSEASIYSPPEAARGQSSAAGDIWSLGMVLVEALTQHPLVWEKTKHEAPKVPEGMPRPFFDIARHCLCWDPRGRWTAAEIVQWLKQSAGPPPREPLASSKRSIAKMRRYIVPTLSVLLTLGATIVGSTLLRRRQKISKMPSAVPEVLRARPQKNNILVTPPAGQVTVGISKNEQAPSDATAVPTPEREIHPEPGRTSAAIGLVPGKVVQHILPAVPVSARETIQGTIRVSVRVSLDSSGAVTEAEFDSPGPSKYFANLALEAAQAWTFEPPSIDGRGILSDWLLRFEFTKDATRVLPTQIAP